MIGASAAIAVSDIPWAGPIGGVSVGLVDGEIVINPNQEQRAVSKLSLTVAGTDEAVLMVEAGAKEISEADMLRAILTGWSPSRSRLWLKSARKSAYSRLPRRARM